MRARLLLILSCLSAPALADEEDCRAVRRAVTLAANNAVHVGDLASLELRVCSHPPRAACQQLEEFWMLSMALQQPRETTSVLEAQRAVWCGREAEPTHALQWPDGQQLRSSSGTLSWPEGAIARSSSGSWSAPSGTLVRSSSGSLTYPGGMLARSSSGRWSLPSGALADEGRIASLACAHEVQWCRFFMGELNRPAGVTRDFAQLGLGMLAGQKSD